MADPHRHPKADDKFRERVRKLVLEGHSVNQVAESVGASRAMVARAVEHMGGIRRIRAGEDE